jgi:hypothetical protein
MLEDGDAFSAGFAPVSVENPDVVDVVSTTLDGQYVVLTIADHLPWDASNEHLLGLQEKRNRYVAFIESGGEIPQRRRPRLPDPGRVPLSTVSGRRNVPASKQKDHRRRRVRLRLEYCQ